MAEHFERGDKVRYSDGRLFSSGHSVATVTHTERGYRVWIDEIGVWVPDIYLTNLSRRYAVSGARGANVNFKRGAVYKIGEYGTQRYIYGVINGDPQTMGFVGVVDGQHCLPAFPVMGPEVAQLIVEVIEVAPSLKAWVEGGMQ